MKALLADMTSLLLDKMSVSGSKMPLSADQEGLSVGKIIRAAGKNCLSADQTAQPIEKIKGFGVGIPDATQFSMNTTTSLHVSHRYTPVM
jgi:hypothetical protein